MRRVDDHQPLAAARGCCAARLQATAPPQSCATSASIGAPSVLDQRGDVGHQVLGAVGLRRRPAPTSARSRAGSARRSGSAAPKRCSTLVPDEGRLGKAVQEQQHAARRSGAARRGSDRRDAVRQRLIVASSVLRSSSPRCAQPCSASAASPTPRFVSAENSVDADVGLVGGQLAQRLLRRAQRALRLAAVELVGLGQQHQQLAPRRCRRAARRSASSCWSRSVKPRRESTISTTPREAAPQLEVVGHHLLPAQLGAALDRRVAVARQVGEQRVGRVLRAELEQVDVLRAARRLATRRRAASAAPAC